MSNPAIWRRDRAAVKARLAARKAADEAYRQQFVDAAAADQAAASTAVTASTKPSQPQQQQQQAKPQHNNAKR